MVGICSRFLSTADLPLKFTFVKYFFRNTIRVLNSLDPYQTQRLVGPKLVPTCLQWLSTEKEFNNKNVDQNSQMLFAKTISRNFNDVGK